MRLPVERSVNHDPTRRALQIEGGNHIRPWKMEKRKSTVLQEPEIIVGVAGRSSSATLLEAKLVNNTCGASLYFRSARQHLSVLRAIRKSYEFIPAVLKSITAEVGPLERASAEGDELKVVGLDEECRARSLSDGLRTVDEDSTVRGCRCLRRHVLAGAGDYK